MVSLIATCKELAIEAGKAIREIFTEYDGNVEYEDKRTPEEIEVIIHFFFLEKKEGGVVRNDLVNICTLFFNKKKKKEYIQRKIEEERRKDEEKERQQQQQEQQEQQQQQSQQPPQLETVSDSEDKSESRTSSAQSTPRHRRKPSIKDVRMSPKLVQQTSLRSLDPRTIADVTANAWIVENLAYHFPAYPSLHMNGLITLSSFLLHITCLHMRVYKYLQMLTIKSEEGDGKFKAREEFSEEDTEHILDNPYSELRDANDKVVDVNPGLSSISEKDIVVWVDPLDGTKAFIKGDTKSVTVLIGIANNTTGECIAGIVHRPFMDITVVGICNTGVFTYGYNEQNTQDIKPYVHMLTHQDIVKSIPLRKNMDTNQWPRRAVSSGVHVYDEVKPYLRACRLDEQINAGGAGNKGLLVIEKECDVFLFPQFGTKKWDTCAINAIFNSIKGGCFTDCTGTPLSYKSDVNVNNDNGFVASLYGEEYHKSFLFPDLIFRKNLPQKRISLRRP
ncbi:pap-inositol-14-phosphatase [Reticulomyxa filosa]|uniref:Pap-inositol-14-phosphatase n=1 Tax=Reticulomyxa filosa TaxID=46433 RepID=X6LUB6_RETFI|nr:pap-inositol-14-phosphatase [Reticulomyxa filosa]|eukprot:ETO04951.1 pap-inositol-14-phosphatase [Reticulomyxa filosa]